MGSCLISRQEKATLTWRAATASFGTTSTLPLLRSSPAPDRRGTAIDCATAISAVEARARRGAGARAAVRPRPRWRSPRWRFGPDTARVPGLATPLRAAAPPTGWLHGGGLRDEGAAPVRRGCRGWLRPHVRQLLPRSTVQWRHPQQRRRLDAALIPADGHAPALGIHLFGAGYSAVTFAVEAVDH